MAAEDTFTNLHQIYHYIKKESIQRHKIIEQSPTNYQKFK